MTTNEATTDSRAELAREAYASALADLKADVEARQDAATRAGRIIANITPKFESEYAWAPDMLDVILLARFLLDITPEHKDEALSREDTLAAQRMHGST